MTHWTPIKASPVIIQKPENKEAGDRTDINLSHLPETIKEPEIKPEVAPQKVVPPKAPLLSAVESANQQSLKPEKIEVGANGALLMCDEGAEINNPEALSRLKNMKIGQQIRGWIPQMGGNEKPPEHLQIEFEESSNIFWIKNTNNGRKELLSDKSIKTLTEEGLSPLGYVEGKGDEAKYCVELLGQLLDPKSPPDNVGIRNRELLGLPLNATEFECSEKRSIMRDAAIRQAYGLPENAPEEEVTKAFEQRKKTLPEEWKKYEDLGMFGDLPEAQNEDYSGPIEYLFEQARKKILDLPEQSTGEDAEKAIQNLDKRRDLLGRHATSNENIDDVAVALDTFKMVRLKNLYSNASGVKWNRQIIKEMG